MISIKRYTCRKLLNFTNISSSRPVASMLLSAEWHSYEFTLLVQEEKCDYFKKFKWQCVQTSHVPVCAKKYCESGVSFQNSNNCIFYHYFCLPFKLNGPPEQQRSRFRLTHQMALQCICRTHSIRSAQLDASLFFPTRK